MFTLFNHLWLPLFDTDEGGSGGGDGGTEGTENTEEQHSEETGGQTDPPWKAEDFDGERAWKKIQAQDADKKKQKERIDELEREKKEREDAEKSDQEKLEERAKDAEERADTAENELLRLRVAVDKGLTESQAKRLVGKTKEELEADADELLESFKSEGDEEQDSHGRPKPKLRPGAAPSSSSSDDELPDNPDELAARVPTGRW